MVTQEQAVIRAVTSIDVARLAGVSQSAVSRAFSPGSSISDQTKQKVLAAAESLGYRPNRIPAIMLSGRSCMVGVVIGGLENPFYATALERLATALRESGLQVLLMHVDDALTLDNALDQLVSYRIDAIVTSLAIGSKTVAQALSRLRIPVVCFNSSLVGPWISTVNSDNHGAGFTAARLIMEKGRVRPVWLAGPERNAASLARAEGFLQGLQQTRTSPIEPTRLQGDDTYDSGYEAILSLKKQGIRPDSLFASNDMMACGAMDALREEMDLRCPDDVIMLGYDNIPQATWRSYDLTSFDQCTGKMVARALELLEKAFQAKDSSHSHTHIIDAKLIERGSTRLPL
ncbi:LacI family DNA-binding transcriptional regulator [Acetobacter sicerae]|uniref:LacI family DNA-binding transcriptional regulator n=1 Tax=Acetobacter sicerae TaxID=85325 RepID=A0ABS8VWF6_9PROT|nr:LacI family DNA-binding transcriptional regulator [Acetobacter sicerae]MCE0743994.1 LacI family DNA-binding transcriptional regulator [Acetobacter sicerae]